MFKITIRSSVQLHWLGTGGGQQILIVIESERFERFWSFHAYGAKVIEILKTVSTKVVFEGKKTTLNCLDNGRVWRARILQQI